MNASELGAVSSFHFWVLSDSDSQGNGATADYAPDTGTYAYALAGGAPTVSETPVIKRIAYPASLLYPRVGKLYSARQIKVGLSTGELVRPETLSCRLLVQHKLVRPLPGGCRWRIPANLAGKSAVLKVDLTYRGAKATDSWHVMIRA
jgi:hypothetical protein